MARRGERVERSSGAAPPRQSGGSGPLEIAIEDAADGVCVIALGGELDLNTIPRVERRLLRELEAGSAVVLDLSRLSFIDSSGIGLLIRAVRANDGTRMPTVIARDSQVERVFRVAGIDEPLELYFDRDEALAELDGI